MNPVRPLLAIFITITLVSMQASGIHLHVNTAGAGGIHSSNIHESGLNDQDHFGDTDVSLFEVISSATQAAYFVAVFVFALLVVTKCEAHLWAASTRRLGPRHRSRWRPPLRAPPAPSS